MSIKNTKQLPQNCQMSVSTFEEITKEPENHYG